MVTVGKHMYLYAKVLLELHLGILAAFSSCISVLSNNFEYISVLYEHTVRCSSASVCIFLLVLLAKPIGFHV